MEEKIEKNNWGFYKGLQEVFNTCSAATYSHCLNETREICMSTEKGRGNSYSSYYNKMYGKKPLSVAETEKIGAIFARLGITDWQGGRESNN